MLGRSVGEVRNFEEEEEEEEEEEREALTMTTAACRDSRE